MEFGDLDCAPKFPQGQGGKKEANLDAHTEGNVGEEESSLTSSDSSKQSNSNKNKRAYTITKQKREVWTEDEHKRFVDGVRMYQRDWKTIEKHVGTKSVIQIRSHAQKYFLKLQKCNPSDEPIPPPRPKRPSREGKPAKRIRRKSSSLTKRRDSNESCAASEPVQTEGALIVRPKLVDETDPIGSSNSKSDHKKRNSLVSTRKAKCAKKNFLDFDDEDYCEVDQSKAKELADLKSEGTRDEFSVAFPNAKASWIPTSENVPPARESMPNPALSQWIAYSYILGMLPPGQGPTPNAIEQKPSVAEQTHKTYQHFQQQQPVQIAPATVSVDSWLVETNPNNHAGDLILFPGCFQDMMAPPVMDLQPQNSTARRASFSAFDNEQELQGQFGDHYYSLLGKQIEMMEKQVPRLVLPDERTVEPSLKRRLSDHVGTGNNGVGIGFAANDFFSNFPEYA